MVDSVAGSVVGSQLQSVRSSVTALKVEKELTEAAVKSIDENTREPPSNSGRGSIVNIKV